MKNYYDILGITNDANQEEIKAAYRKLSVKFHPDKNQGDKFFEEHFKLIAEAYDTLSHPEKRNAYNIKRKEFQEIDQTHELAEELKDKERNLFKKEVDLRKKIQDVEADKIKYQQKMYHQFEKEKNDLYEKFQQEKETLKKEIAPQFRQARPKNKNYIITVGLILFALIAVYAFVAKNKENKQVASTKKTIVPIDTLKKVPNAIPEKKIGQTEAPAVPSYNYTSKSPIQNNKNTVSGKPIVDNSDHQFAITNNKAELLGSDPNTSWSRDISGNYESPKVLLKIPSGQKVEVLSQISKGGYYLVTYQNQRGYIYQEYLSLE